MKENHNKPRSGAGMARVATWAAVGSVLAGACILGAPKLLAGAGKKTTATRQEGTVLPRPPQKFNGKIGTTAKESKPDFPKPFQAQKGSPNVIVIMTDDVGFGASSTFGGPVSTPTFDKLAQQGLSFNNFHTTALCSPTRAALLTGRNHHSCGIGNIMEFATGYPGYNTIMPKSCGVVAEVLKQNGYGTSWFGKNHNVPYWQSSQAGPFDAWPTQIGFDYFYGFVAAETDQWHPALYEGTKPILPPVNDPTYILDKDLADHAISWLETQHSIAPNKPFFVYYVTGTSHSPHHAPKEWIAKFKGKFDQGWDKVRDETFARQKKNGIIPASTKLTPRPEGIPAWDTLTPDQKRLYARMMEVYAGALSHADHQIGRVIDSLDKMGELDNTIVVYIMGDNGASAEGTLQGTTNEVGTSANGLQESREYLLSMIDELGGPLTHNHYPVGWAHAMDTPFQWTKQVASHYGGTGNGMVISWPARIKDKGTVRGQFTHVIDVVPTIMEAAGITYPVELNGVKQKPLEGVSMVYTFDNPKAPTMHTTQYFEMVANRAIYHDGWIASTTPLRLPWVTIGSSPNPMDFKWELYHVAEDFSQANNLAESNPAKLKELQQVFDREAKKYNVYPLDSSFAERADPSIRPSLTIGRTEFTYYPGMIRISEGVTAKTQNKSFSVIADVEIPQGGANGIIITEGGRSAGWGLMLLNGKPTYVHAYSNQPQHKFRIASNDVLPPGKHTIQFDFIYDGGGLGRGGNGVITVDGKKVAEGRIPRTVPVGFSFDETLDIGMDTGTPVIEDYLSQMPFAFTGKISTVTIKIKPMGKSASAEFNRLRYIRSLSE